MPYDLLKTEIKKPLNTTLLKGAGGKRKQREELIDIIPITPNFQGPGSWNTGCS